MSVSTDEQLEVLDATGLAALVRAGEVSASELTEAAIARIERLNPAINAVVTPMFDRARAAVAAGLPDGPFTGVPFLLKDLLAQCEGVPMKGGSRLMEHFVPRRDSEIVARYRRSGLVILGKTNLPEFGYTPSTESALYGPCRNPWNTGHSAGGSSGGAAAAVAARMVPMAHAGDGGGSIRIPAACCGVFGLKPTRGRITLAPTFGDVQNGLASEHAITRSVRDSAALLDATEGPALGEPYCAPPKVRPYLAEVGADPGKLRIALQVHSPVGSSVHADCVDAVRDAAALCEGLGHTVEEAAPDIDGHAVTDAFGVLWAAGAAQTLDTIARMRQRPIARDEVEPLTWALYELGKQTSASAYLIAVAAIQRIARRVAGFMETYDVWLTPTLARPPVTLGEFAPDLANPIEAFHRAGEYIPFTPIVNATGQPAMSVPLYWNADGLPIGVHFVGRFGEEALLFRLAAQLEAMRPWGQRRP